MVWSFFRNFLWGYIYCESDCCEYVCVKIIILFLSLYFKKLFFFIGFWKLFGKVCLFYRIDNYVLVKNFYNKYSCSYLNSFGWIEIVGCIFFWSVLFYIFLKLFICSVVFELCVFCLIVFCVSYVNWYELCCICNIMVVIDWKKIKELMFMFYGRDVIYLFRLVFLFVVEMKYYKFLCCYLNICRF